MTFLGWETNYELQLAEGYVEHTGCHVFLTGKAGTGKTIFLKKPQESSSFWMKSENCLWPLRSRFYVLFRKARSRGWVKPGL